MIIYTDLHFYGPHDKVSSPEELFSQDIQNTILIGDIVDLKNCPKKELDKAKNLKLKLLNYFGEKYLMGNHELSNKSIFLIKDGIYYTHGDFEFWGEKKAKEYRADEIKGAGKFKFAFKKFIFSFRDFFDAKIDDDFLKAAAAAAQKNNCHTYICGHKHPKKKVEKNIEGVKIIVLPRGKYDYRN